MKAATIGLDIAKQVFQVHGADKSGKVVLRRKLRRSCPVLCSVGTVPGRAGGQWERSLLGTRAERLWSYGEAHGATVCEAVRQVE